MNIWDAVQIIINKLISSKKENTTEHAVQETSHNERLRKSRVQATRTLNCKYTHSASPIIWATRASDFWPGFSNAAQIGYFLEALLVVTYFDNFYICDRISLRANKTGNFSRSGQTAWGQSAFSLSTRSRRESMSGQILVLAKTSPVN